MVWAKADQMPWWPAHVKGPGSEPGTLRICFFKGKGQKGWAEVQIRAEHVQDFDGDSPPSSKKAKSANTNLKDAIREAKRIQGIEKGLVPASDDEDLCDAKKDEWGKCGTCGKWRRFGEHKPPESFTCATHPHQATLTCESPEETMDDNEIWVNDAAAATAGSASTVGPAAATATVGPAVAAAPTSTSTSTSTSASALALAAHADAFAGVVPSAGGHGEESPEADAGEEEEEEEEVKVEGVDDDEGGKAEMEAPSALTPQPETHAGGSTDANDALDTAAEQAPAPASQPETLAEREEASTAKQPADGRQVSAAKGGPSAKAKGKAPAPAPPAPAHAASEDEHAAFEDESEAAMVVFVAMKAEHDAAVKKLDAQRKLQADAQEKIKADVDKHQAVLSQARDKQASANKEVDTAVALLQAAKRRQEADPPHTETADLEREVKRLKAAFAAALTAAKAAQQ